MFEISNYIVHRATCQCWPITKANLRKVVGGELPEPSDLDFYHLNIYGQFGVVRWKLIDGSPDGLDFWEFMENAA